MKKLLIAIAWSLFISSTSFSGLIYSTPNPTMTEVHAEPALHSSPALGSWQWLATEFTLDQAVVINHVDGWILESDSYQSFPNAPVNVVIYSDGGEVPGQVLFSATFTPGDPLDWYGASGLNWPLEAGTYWIAFEVERSQYSYRYEYIMPQARNYSLNGAGWNSGHPTLNYTANDLINLGVRMFDNVTSYTVTPSAGPNGSIFPGSPYSVAEGGTTSFSIVPDHGWQIASVSGCGGSLVGDTYTTAAITEDCTVTATFTLPVNHSNLDLPSGNGGVITDLGGTPELAHDMAIQPDGKILMVGVSHYHSNGDFALFRYNSDGSLDTTFNGNGIVVTDVGSFERGRSVAIQPDGKILVAGYSHNGSIDGSLDMVLLRYNSDGSLDTTFNGNGIVIEDFDGSDELAYCVAVQHDGKILVAGYSHNGNIILLRYNSDGSLDTSFNGSGILIEYIDGSNEIPFSMVLQPDGKILIGVVHDQEPDEDEDIILLRYNNDGSRDKTFNGSGIVLQDIGGSSDAAFSVVLQPNGKILVGGGSVNNGNTDIALLRYNSDGSLDTTFNGSGIVLEDLGGSSEVAESLALQVDGKILLGGRVFWDSPNSSDVVLLRYNSDGSLDTTFNGSGIVIQNVAGYDDLAHSVALQPDGKIMLGGSSFNGNDMDFFLLWYQGTTVQTYTVTSSAGANGRIFPDYAHPVSEGGTTSLAVVPDDGYAINSVSGCGGTLDGNTYTTAPMTADCTVTATFTPIQITHTLDVTIVGQGSVYIDSKDGGICTDDCVQDYVEGTTVPLYINTVGNGYSFAGWTADCTGTFGDCFVTMDTAKNVTATFLEIVPNPVILEGSQGNFTTIQYVYDSLTSGQLATIKVKAGLQGSENLMFDRNVTLRLIGGYDNIFTNIIGDTSFYGTLTIKDGTATISDLIIK